MSNHQLNSKHCHLLIYGNWCFSKVCIIPIYAIQLEKFLLSIDIFFLVCALLHIYYSSSRAFYAGIARGRFCCIENIILGSLISFPQCNFKSKSKICVVNIFVWLPVYEFVYCTSVWRGKPRNRLQYFTSLGAQFNQNNASKQWASAWCNSIQSRQNRVRTSS